MKRLLIAAVSSLALAAAPTFAATIAVTQGSGTNMGVAQDGSSNNIPAGVICGATSSATLYATCANQAFVNASGQLGVIAAQTGSPWGVTGSGSAGSAASGVVTVQGIASMTPVGISAASGAIASGAVASGAVASGAFASGSLASGAGTDGWNVTEGTKADAAYTSGSGSIVAILKGIYTGITSALPAGTNVIGYNTNDPCGQASKTNFAIATSSGNLQLVAGVSAKQVYICSISIVGAGTWVGNLIEGTGAACTTANEAAVIGSTTAASGMSFAANAGMTLGSGSGTVARTATAANGICLLQSGTTALAGNITFVQQ